MGEPIATELQMSIYRYSTILLSMLVLLVAISCSSNGAGDNPSERLDEEDVAGWQIVTIDSPGNTGPYNSIAVDSQCRPHVAYYVSTGGDLEYGSWNGSVWAGKTNDAGPDQVDSFQTGRYPSIGLDLNGNPLIAYHDWQFGHLMFTRWEGSRWCGFEASHGPDTVDMGTSYVGETVGQETSIAVDDSGYPHIVYYDEAEEDVKYVRWTGNAWRGLAHQSAPDSVDPSGAIDDRRPAIALDADGHPHVSYANWTDSTLMYVRWNGAAWVGLAGSTNADSIDGETSIAGVVSSIAIDGNGHPHIAYVNLGRSNEMKYARWDGSTWVGLLSTAGPEVVSVAGSVFNLDLALDSQYRPHVAYYDIGTRCLRYARWNGSAWVGLADDSKADIVDTDGDVGDSTALALDADGHPHITYWDSTNLATKYAYFGQAQITEPAVSRRETAGRAFYGEQGLCRRTFRALR
jgi:hypothetical protein